jgi:hypothetical protein
MVILRALITCVLLFMVSTSYAADQILYVRDGGSGTDCADWSTAHACDQLSTAEALVNRTANDSVTIYVADGTYLGATIDAATSGEKLLTIQKATAAVHGTDTGWDNDYGDGQATFQWITRTDAVLTATAIRLITSYVTIDGGVLMGAVNDIDSYGFIFKYPADMNTNYIAGSNLSSIKAPDTSQTNRTMSNIKILRSAIEGPGDITCINGTPHACPNAGIAMMSTNASTYEIANNYFYGWTVQITFYGTENVTIHDNYFSSNSSGSAAHGEQIVPGDTDNVLIYNNVFYNSKTAVVGYHGKPGQTVENTRHKVYNNIVYKYQAAGTADYLTVGFGCNDTNLSNTMVGAEIHHNTFVDVKLLSAVAAGTVSDVDTKKSYAYNNLFYNCASPRMDNTGKTAGAIVHDNNAYLKCTGTYNNADETAPQVDTEATSAIFTNYASGNFTIAAANQAAIDHIIDRGNPDIVASYPTDRAGNSRGASPDIGAYEAGASADITAPVLTEVTPMPPFSSNQAVKYTFSTTEAGTVTYGGTCGNGTLSYATLGENTTEWNLGIGTYSDCSIIVTDAASNASDPLLISEFTIRPESGVMPMAIGGGAVFMRLP